MTRNDRSDQNLVRTWPAPPPTQMQQQPRAPRWTQNFKIWKLAARTRPCRSTNEMQDRTFTWPARNLIGSRPRSSSTGLKASFVYNLLCTHLDQSTSQCYLCLIKSRHSSNIVPVNRILVNISDAQWTKASSLPPSVGTALPDNI